MVSLGYASGYENFRSSSINYLSNLSSNNVINLFIMIVGQVDSLLTDLSYGAFSLQGIILVLVNSCWEQALIILQSTMER